MGKVVETDIQMRFADADSLGHVNNVNLQHYFDVGKMDFYEKSMGKTVNRDNESLILVSACTNYYQQTRLYDKVYVETSVEVIGIKSVTFFQKLINRETAMVNADCRTVAVGFNFETQQTFELKQEWKIKLSKYVP